ncbi:MAG: hypothetical protein NC390_07090 [Fusobacterium sp.]|nr:hypothetical protein [Fusobacterium sp.]
MGLAASQARLLTITSRKSRAQFESMRLSHQKLALSRNLTDISNEYQNSLDQTKLYYDFYGVNSTDTPLTYNMLMSPSSINDYTPTLISNNQGQIVLSAPYATAAKNAGIPQEGLGCTPSSLMRDAFIQNLAQSGVITQATADAICAVDYNNKAGLGSDNLVNTITTTGSYEDLLAMLKGEGADGVYLDSSMLVGAGARSAPTVLIGKAGDTGSYKVLGDNGDHGHGVDGRRLEEISFGDLLDGTEHVMLAVESDDNGCAKNYFTEYDAVKNTAINMVAGFGQALVSLLGDDPSVADAIAYAESQMNSELWVDGTPPTGKSNNWWTGSVGGWFGANQYVKEERNWWTVSVHSGSGKESKENGSYNNALNYADETMAMVNSYRSKKVWFGNKQESIAAIDVTNLTKAYFTYFMQYMEGLGSAKSNSWYINWRDKVSNQSFADKDSIGDYEFVFSSTKVSDNEALISNFYDTLFNQICVNGWTENNEVATDSSYLKEMLQNGMMYITSMSDDYYFYQNNYATNTFIKEVSDDAAIAQAESKYTTEKARINAKEQELDLKMKNLDTEISSLETEYEAVKKVIEGNVSKSFTRYDS